MPGGRSQQTGAIILFAERKLNHPTSGQRQPCYFLCQLKRPARGEAVREAAPVVAAVAQ